MAAVIVEHQRYMRAALDLVKQDAVREYYESASY